MQPLVTVTASLSKCPLLNHRPSLFLSIEWSLPQQNRHTAYLLNVQICYQRLSIKAKTSTSGRKDVQPAKEGSSTTVGPKACQRRGREEGVDIWVQSGDIRCPDDCVVCSQVAKPSLWNYNSAYAVSRAPHFHLLRQPLSSSLALLDGLEPIFINFWFLTLFGLAFDH